MELEKLQAVLRPRQSWEAMDLGVAFVRRWARPIWTTWALTVLPLQLLVAVLLRDHLGWTLFVLWWLKPLYEMSVLFILGHSLFGSVPTVSESLRQVPRRWLRHGLRALTLGHFDECRSFLAPAEQLEGLKGSALRARRRVLSRTQRTSAGLLTWTCLVIEGVLALGVVSLVLLAVPAHLVDWTEVWHLIVDETQAVTGTVARGAVVALVCLVWGLVTPFYVGAGFSLYLNRRTQLEGWDLELAFRRLTRSRAAQVAALLVLSLALSPWLVSTARAQDDVVEGPNRVEQAMERVLAHPEAQTKRKVTRWVADNPSKPPELPDGDGIRLFQVLGRALGTVAEVLMWLVFGAILIWLVLMLVPHAIRWREGPNTDRRKRAPLEPARAGLLGMPGAALPDADAVPAMARRLWSAGRHTEALGLLYRSAVLCLVEERGLVIPEGATEHECLGSVAKKLPQCAPFMGRLTRTWQAAAYAHRTCAEADFDSLCRSWSRSVRKAES